MMNFQVYRLSLPQNTELYLFLYLPHSLSQEMLTLLIY